MEKVAHKCPACEGFGVIPHADMEAQRKFVDCLWCEGTGLITIRRLQMWEARGRELGLGSVTP